MHLDTVTIFRHLPRNLQINTRTYVEKGHPYRNVLI